MNLRETLTKLLSGVVFTRKQDTKTAKRTGQLDKPVDPGRFQKLSQMFARDNWFPAKPGHPQNRPQQVSAEAPEFPGLCTKTQAAGCG